MKIFLLYTGGIVFIVSAISHIYVKLKLRPKQSSNLDEIYWEFEDNLPALRRYNRFSQITFVAMALGALLLFLTFIF